MIIENNMQTPLIVFIIGVVILVALIVFLIRRFVPLRYLRHHHEVGFPIFLQIGVIYAVLLAFVFSAEWDGYLKAQRGIEEESSDLLTLMHLAQEFPKDLKSSIEEEITDYTILIINQDWPDMQNNKGRLNTWGNLTRLQNIYLKMEPKTKRDDFFYTESLKYLEDLRQSRQKRIFTVNENRPWILWLVISIMGTSIVCVSFLFGMRYLWSQIALTSCLAAMITTIILVTIVLSTPFTGRFALKPHDFEEVLAKFYEVKRIS